MYILSLMYLMILTSCWVTANLRTGLDQQTAWSVLLQKISLWTEMDQANQWLTREEQT